MAISAQDKILYVANKLGLSTLKNMQGSTGAVYDTDANNQGVLFANCAQHQWVSQTNLSDNRFEVNSALLIETIAFYAEQEGGQGNLLGNSFQSGLLAVNDVIVFDLIIGNKVVMKDTPVFGAGGPYTFATNASVGFDGFTVPVVLPRHQVFMEGAGILIPPQVEWSINFSVYNTQTGAKIDLSGTTAYQQGQRIAAYLYGTQVLLNFNTSI